MSQFNEIAVSNDRATVAIPQFIERLEKAEVKLRLCAELVEFLHDGQLANVDGVSLNLSEAADELTALVRELRLLPEEMGKRWCCPLRWEISLVPAIEDARCEALQEVDHA